ncbi:uncharacterized protein EAE97_004844 [Botrytis byssoidea]|uniref:Uncharacterized protein n=1 Tax=Botrytis byssoidea TaxID=139641 RepID=A0A9P5IQX1_9HELO|nr:uncharacterized protein EAE97_004844 [Botrytis byssoidea]KAF7945806.1 hypothetical protein EAE97_004844 [Botrytis byssoidea]
MEFKSFDIRKESLDYQEWPEKVRNFLLPQYRVLSAAKLGRKVRIKGHAKARQGARIGDRAFIADDAHVLRGVHVGRGVTLQEGEVDEKNIPGVRGRR